MRNSEAARERGGVYDWAKCLVRERRERSNSFTAHL